MLIRTSRITLGRRPSGPFSLNWASPQARGLLAWWPMASFGPYAELVHGRNIVPNANGLIRAGLDGLTLDTSNVNRTHASNPQVPLASAPVPTLADTYTFSCWVRPLDTTGFGDTCAFSQWTGGQGWMLFINTGGIVRAYSGGNHTDGAIAIPVGAWSLILGTVYTTPSSTCDLYVNGILDASGANGGIALTADLQWGQYGSSNGTGGRFQIADSRIYGRSFIPADVWALYDGRTRWDLYWQPSSRLFLDLGAAPAAAPFDWWVPPAGPDRTPAAVVGYET